MVTGTGERYVHRCSRICLFAYLSGIRGQFLILCLRGCRTLLNTAGPVDSAEDLEEDRMRKCTLGIVFLVVAMVALTLTGCFPKGDDGANPTALATANSPLPLPPGQGATVRFSIQIGPNTDSLVRPTIRLATDTASGTPTIATGTTTTATTTASVTVRFALTMIKVGQLPPNNTVVTEQIVPADNGIAEAVFYNVEPKPTLADVEIRGPANTGIDCIIGTATVRVANFHGAADLVPGENAIAVHPTQSRFRRDIIATTLKWLVLQNDLMPLTSGSTLVNMVERCVSYMDRGPVTAYADAQTLVREYLTRNWGIELNIASPTASFTFTAPATISVVLNVVDATGTVDALELYLNNTKITDLPSGQTTYTHEIASPTPGRYVLRAIAFNKPGELVASSVEVPFTVALPVIPPPVPTITITSPSNNATFTVGSSIPFTVVASGVTAAVDRIAKIVFYEGTNVIGEDAMAPYEYTWDNVATLATYVISARAIGRLDDNVATSADVSIGVVPVPTWNGTASYTSSADFAQGTMTGLENRSVTDQLQLSSSSTTLPFIWVPNSNEGTISKVNTRTGKELGRYRLAKVNNSSPSRTTVDMYGNCWVGCRETGTVVKVGLEENGPFVMAASGTIATGSVGGWIDRNGNGRCDTSRDTNNNGKIDSTEILPFGQDECVLLEVVLMKGRTEDVFVPGTYTGAYANNSWSFGPRGIAIDRHNNCWAGVYGTRMYYYLDGTTGRILKKIDVSRVNHSPYGAVVDRNGMLWSASLANHVLWLNTADDTFGVVNLSNYSYGITCDRNGNVYASGGSLRKIDGTTKTVLWSQSCSGSGVCTTDDGDVWVAGGQTYRYSSTGTRKAVISTNDAKGVSVGEDGMVWSVQYGAELIKINPSNNQIAVRYTIGAAHYSYSDMTGIVVRSNTTRLGTWNVVRDTGRDNTVWNNSRVNWTSVEPASTSITIKVRSSTDNVTWSAWETATRGQLLTATPGGRYLQIEAIFQVNSGNESPVLKDLTIGN